MAVRAPFLGRWRIQRRESRLPKTGYARPVARDARAEKTAQRDFDNAGRRYPRDHHATDESLSSRHAHSNGKVSHISSSHLSRGFARWLKG